MVKYLIITYKEDVPRKPGFWSKVASWFKPKGIVRKAVKVPAQGMLISRWGEEMEVSTTEGTWCQVISVLLCEG